MLIINSFQISYQEPLIDILYRQIFNLKVELEESRKTTQNYKAQYENCKKELDWLKKSVSQYVTDDQLAFMSGKKVHRWSDQCIQKAIVLKQLGGDKLINFCRKYLIPVPSCSSLYSITQNFHYSPGIVHFNLNLLKLLTDNFNGVELFADLKIDEKSITPGQSYEPSTCSFVGTTTLPISSRLATNAFAVLITLMKVRIKMLVGYHFMDNVHDTEALNQFLSGLIIKIEEMTKIKVKSLTMDMSPANISLVNSMGLSTKKFSRQFWFTHPTDKSRKLYVIFDPVHNMKNLANGLRNHKITLTDEVVKKYNLNSKTASIKDIESVFKKQKDMIYKPCVKLKKEVLNPNHWERMRESTAFHLIDEDVSIALDYIHNASTQNFIYSTDSNQKINTTSWILRFFNRYSTLLLKTLWTQNNFDENASWLLNEAVPILESLIFEKAYLRCTTGAVIGIYSTIELIRQFLDQGISAFNPEWLSNNSIENYFSQIVRFAPKPSALSFVRAAKSLSISRYMHDSLNTNYSWSHNNVSFCSEFLKILRQRPASNSSSDNGCIDLQIPETITWESLFKTKLELNAFIIAMHNLVEKFLTKISCDNCKSRFMIYSPVASEGSVLYRMKCKSPWELSMDVQCLFLSLEFIYRQLNCILLPSDHSFNQIFINIVSAQIEVEFEHCQDTIDKLLRAFVEFRKKLQYECRLLHKRNEFASKNN